MINEIVRRISDKEKKHCKAEAALICIALTLTCTFWRFEGYISPKIMDALNIISAAMMICGWIYFSFSEGVMKRSGFAVFSAFYWIIPTLIYCYSDSMTDPQKYNIWVHILGEFSKLTGGYALAGIPILKKMNAVTSAVIFSSVCIMIHIAGIICANKMEKK